MIYKNLIELTWTICFIVDIFISWKLVEVYNSNKSHMISLLLLTIPYIVLFYIQKKWKITKVRFMLYCLFVVCVTLTILVALLKVSSIYQLSTKMDSFFGM
jgi:hypothetical protein